MGRLVGGDPVLERQQVPELVGPVEDHAPREGVDPKADDGAVRQPQLLGFEIDRDGGIGMGLDEGEQTLENGSRELTAAPSGPTGARSPPMRPR